MKRKTGPPGPETEAGGTMKVTATTKDAYDLFHQGTLALARMEDAGVRVDTDYLDRAAAEWAARIARQEAELRSGPVWDAWVKRYGRDANLASREQLGKVLFDDLKFPSPGYTEKSKEADKKRHSTANSDLARLNDPWVGGYLGLERDRKALSTYLVGLRREVVDGFVHPSYHLAGGGGGGDEKGGARSGRSSCSAPNWQNQIKRNPELARAVRRCYVPRKGRVLIDVDFSGIEVMMSCCYTKDPQLIADFTQGGDAHRDTAALLFGLDVDYLKQHKDWAKKTVRDWTKNRFVFPQFYGSVYFQCAPHLWEAVVEREPGSDGCRWKLPDSGKSVYAHLKSQGIKQLGACDPARPPQAGTFEHRVKEVEDDFWQRRFKVYSQWKRDWWRAYQENGEFVSLTGFKVQGLQSRNDVLNYGQQGSAFHCLLWSIVEIQKELDRRKMRTKLVGQIHDCLVADVPRGEVQDYLDLAVEVMTVRLPKHWDWIIVPLAVEAEVAEDNWAEQAVWVRGEGGRWGPVKK